MYEDALTDVYRGLLGRSPTVDEIERESPKLKSMILGSSNGPANFLKHADHDQNDFINESEMNTDDLLLEACTFYTVMGVDLTAEMRSFGRWHLAVYRTKMATCSIQPPAPFMNCHEKTNSKLARSC